MPPISVDLNERCAWRVSNGYPNHQHQLLCASCSAPMHADDKRSPRSLQTCIQPSEYCTQNRDLSEKMSLSRSCIQVLSFSASVTV
ncbi:hypothetical protein TNCV_3597791 [Trichonephila clavipes]|nr:hypothetical protein TNCV_3597791 [Trichonephila clavipes]